MFNKSLEFHEKWSVLADIACDDHGFCFSFTLFVQYDVSYGVLCSRYYVWRANVLEYTVQKKTVTTMLAYPWKCTVLYCNHLGNTWKPLVLMTRHFVIRLLPERISVHL